MDRDFGTKCGGRTLWRGLLVLPATIVLSSLVPLHGEDAEPLEKGHGQVAVPFLKRNCLGCHDDKERSGEVVLQPLVEKGFRDHRGLWRRAERQLAAKQMPPEDQPQPDDKEREAFLAWVKKLTSTPDEKGADPGRVTVRRLNRAEYSYTVQDLLHVRARPHDEFPADDAGYGFDRIGDVLTVPPILLERYIEAAEAISAEAISDARTIQARRTAADLTLKDATGADKSGWKVLYTTGRVEASFRVPRTGEHTLRVRAYGEHTGAEVVKVALLADDKEIKRFDVPGDEKKPDLLEVKLRLDTGDRKISVSFLNGGDAKKHDRRLGIDYVELEGPPEKGGLPWAHATYFDKRPPLGAKPEVRKALAKEVLAPVASRAWRRPARPDELEKLAKLVELAVTENESWERGLQLALQAILCSPSFIFRLELEAQRKGDAEVLDEHALATRLSYFLWSSLPDDELKNEADQGTLRKNIVAETKRLLADPRASRLTEQFAVQWLHLRRLDGFVPDPGAFPNFDDALRQAARSETEHLFETILREDRPVRDLVDADFTFVNERLARHYGIEGVSGAEMQRVPAPPERRGLLGHASVLMATSNPTRTSPVKRGRWVLEVLLDEPPPPPVAGADSFTDSERAAKTLRERLEIHRSKPECATCHSRMDPLGFALERFDPIGAIREKDGENPIDDEGALPDKTKLAGATGLRTWLAARSGRIARALAKKLLIFATGRGSIAGDEDPLDQVIDACAPDYKLQDLIVALVQLDAFQKRRANGGK